MAILIDALVPTAAMAARYETGAPTPFALCGGNPSSLPGKHGTLPFRHCALCCAGVHSLAAGSGGFIPTPATVAILVQRSWSLTSLPSLPGLRGAVLPRGPPVAV